MSQPPHVQRFNNAFLRAPDALNAFREENGRPPVLFSPILNFNAFDRARHLLTAGLQDDTPFADTVRAFDGQDLSVSVELVRKWPSIKDDPADYLLPWTKEEAARAVLLGDYGYAGLSGYVVALDAARVRSVVVMVLTNQETPLAYRSLI